jgi:hypothetical protein
MRAFISLAFAILMDGCSAQPSSPAPPRALQQTAPPARNIPAGSLVALDDDELRTLAKPCEQRLADALGDPSLEARLAKPAEEGRIAGTSHPGDRRTPRSCIYRVGEVRGPRSGSFTVYLQLHQFKHGYTALVFMRDDRTLHGVYFDLDPHVRTVDGEVVFSTATHTNGRIVIGDDGPPAAVAIDGSYSKLYHAVRLDDLAS